MGVIGIYSPWIEELNQLKNRLVKMEEEIRQLKETPRVNSIEYHIQNLNVESIRNGILDLGVHMGNEMDKRIQSSGEPERQETQQPLPDQMQSVETRLQQMEQNIMEVKERVQGTVDRLSEMEERCRQWEQRLQYLEAMHP